MVVAWAQAVIDFNAESGGVLGEFIALQLLLEEGIIRALVNQYR